MEHCSSSMRLVKGLLERCVQVVEQLSALPDGARLSELARALDLPKTAGHRLLAELTRLGWVEQLGADGPYRLTTRLPLLTQRVLHATGLPDLAQPVLESVARQSGELARLTVALPDQLVWLAQVQGAPPGLMYQPTLSDPVRPHATANGKAWLATLPQARALAIARNAGLGTLRPTPRTLATSTQLVADLIRTRRRGYALAEEEAERGVVALAVSIGAPALGTISVAGPMLRLPRARHAALAATLKQAALELAAAWPRLRPQHRASA
jgi:DNA-binding IclR family transcriptional regulator